MTYLYQKSKFSLLLLLACFFFVKTAFADDPTQWMREWTRIDVTGPWSSEYKSLRYEVFFENRNQETRLDFSNGYRFTPFVSLWGGFTWISPNDGTAQIYRPWQQLTWALLEKNPIMLFQTRTRLEELKKEGQPEWSLKVRERWRVAFPDRIAHFTPVIYDEVFFNANQPSWVTSGIVDQNRAFIGFDTPPWKKTFVEIGYLNQYLFTEPVNRMAHVILVYFMIELG